MKYFRVSFLFFSFLSFGAFASDSFNLSVRDNIYNPVAMSYKADSNNCFNDGDVSVDKAGLVFFCENNKWTSNAAAGGVTGSICGLYIDRRRAVGGIDSILCEGVNVKNGCPIGYSHRVAKVGIRGSVNNRTGTVAHCVRK